jgi:hypothetical protein
MFGISREVNLYVGSIGVSFKACINCVLFFVLNVYGRGVSWLIFCVNSFDDLYTVAFHQLTMGRIGWLRLWIFMRPFVVGADGFSFRCFHLESCGISVWLWFIVFLIWFWKVSLTSVIQETRHWWIYTPHTHQNVSHTKIHTKINTKYVIENENPRYNYRLHHNFI